MKRFNLYVFAFFLISIPSYGRTEMTVNEPTVIHETNALPPEEVSLRLFQLLDSIRSTDDLTPELISQKTGLPSFAVANRPKNFNFGAPINQSWTYSYSLFYNQSLNKMVLNFEFHPISNDTRQSMKDICSIDLGGYHQQLQKMKFEYIGEQRAHRPGRQYKRKNLSVYIWYAGESAENVLHDCVIAIEIK